MPTRSPAQPPLPPAPSGSPYDVAVVGAGLLGLATARSLLMRRPDLHMVVVDKETSVASHQSSHNSGVLHAGVYYKPGSLKARLCVEGKTALERYASEKGIPFVRCGKLVVAVRPSEFGRLADLRDRARGNGVGGVRELDGDAVRDLEPNVVALRALHVPGTSIIDFGEVARAYATDVQTMGGEITLGTRVLEVMRRKVDRVLRTAAGDIVARSVISCAGLQADRLARDEARPDDLRIIPFRGDYYQLVEDRRDIVTGLVYPVPDPSLPFLGVHFTRRIDGAMLAGPNAVLAFSREGYRRRDVSGRDVLEIAGFPGFWKLGRRYWRTGVAEMWRDVVKAAFVRELQRYVPSVRGRDLLFGPSGVRAQAVSREGQLVDDFSIVAAERELHVRNAPSPGATASLAIGAYLAEKALGHLDL